MPAVKTSTALALLLSASVLACAPAPAPLHTPPGEATPPLGKVAPKPATRVATSSEPKVHPASTVGAKRRSPTCHYCDPINSPCGNTPKSWRVDVDGTVESEVCVDGRVVGFYAPVDPGIGPPENRRELSVANDAGSMVREQRRHGPWLLTWSRIGSRQR